MGNRQVVDRYVDALSNTRLDELASLLHDEYVLTYPQSGETFRGAANAIGIIRDDPGTDRGKGISLDVGRVIGADDTFVTAIGTGLDRRTGRRLR